MILVYLNISKRRHCDWCGYAVMLSVKRFNGIIFWKLSVIIRTRLRYQTRIWSFLRNRDAQCVDRFNLYLKIILQCHFISRYYLVCASVGTVNHYSTRSTSCLKHTLIVSFRCLQKRKYIKAADFAGAFRLDCAATYDDDTRSYLHN